MKHDGFDLVYSFIFSFTIALVICIFPFGLQLYGKLFKNDFQNESLKKIVIPYFIILIWFTTLHIGRLWINDCKPICAFIWSPYNFKICCNLL